MKEYFFKFLIRKVESFDEAGELGKNVRNENWEYKIFSLSDGDYIFKIFDKNGNFKSEFFCSPIVSQSFVFNALNF